MQYMSDKQMYQVAQDMMHERIRMAQQESLGIRWMEAAERVISSALGRMMQRFGRSLIRTGKRLECFNTPRSVPSP